MKNLVVSVHNMSVKFGDFYAVHNVSFDVSVGQIFGFLGANGAGKTTTIRVLCGLLLATSGDVIVDGIKFVSGQENEIKQRVGYMSQRFTLYDDLTIEENFDFAAALHQLNARVYKQNKENLLGFIGLNLKLNTVVKNLPVGIKQQIALCVALLHNPKIVFLDEPTAGVAPTARLRFWMLIKNLAKSGKTVFVTTHYMDEAENCNRIALMRAGELIAVDSPQKLKQNTFGDTLYLLRPRVKNPVHPIPDVIDIWQPYGAGFHLRFKDGIKSASQLRMLKRDWEIMPISASLEDVFIRLVEGSNR